MSACYWHEEPEQSGFYLPRSHGERLMGERLGQASAGHQSSSWAVRPCRGSGGFSHSTVLRSFSYQGGESELCTVGSPGSLACGSVNRPVDRCRQPPASGEGLGQPGKENCYVC